MQSPRGLAADAKELKSFFGEQGLILPTPAERPLPKRIARPIVAIPRGARTPRSPVALRWRQEAPSAETPKAARAACGSGLGKKTTWGWGFPISIEWSATRSRTLHAGRA